MLFIRFTVHVYRKSKSICVRASFPFGFEGGMWDLTVLVPMHCLSFLLSTSCARWVSGGQSQGLASSVEYLIKQVGNKDADTWFEQSYDFFYHAS